MSVLILCVVQVPQYIPVILFHSKPFMLIAFDESFQYKCEQCSKWGARADLQYARYLECLWF